MEQASFYQGAPPSHGQHPFPYDPSTTVPICRRLHASATRRPPRPPAVEGTSAIQRGSLASAGPALQNGPVCRPRPPSLANVSWPECGIHRSLGPLCGPLPHVATTDPAFVGHPLGSASMGLCAGNLAGRQPPAPAFSLGARQRLWPWNQYWLAHHGPRPLGLRPPRSRSRGKRHRRDAPSSSNKKRKTSHSPDWRSSSSSSESGDADSRGACAPPPPPQRIPQRRLDKESTEHLGLSHGQRRLVRPPSEASDSCQTRSLHVRKGSMLLAIVPERPGRGAS